MKTLDHFYYNVQSAAMTYTNFIRLLLVTNRGAGGGGSGSGGLLELYFTDRRRN